MDARLPSALLVAAMIRRTQDAGGFAAVLARGDEGGGAILVAAVTGGRTRFLERGIGPAGKAMLIDMTPTNADIEVANGYWQRRRSRDPDLWVIELDIPDAERFVAEALLPN